MEEVGFWSRVTEGAYNIRGIFTGDVVNKLEIEFAVQIARLKVIRIWPNRI